MTGTRTNPVTATETAGQELVARFKDQLERSGDRNAFLSAVLDYLSLVFAKETFSRDPQHAAAATFLFDQLQKIIGKEPMMNSPPAGLSEEVFSSLELTVSPELQHELETLAEDLHVTEGDALAKAVALLRLAVDARKEGKRVAILDEDLDEVDREITGL